MFFFVEGWHIVAFAGLLAFVSNVLYMLGGTDGFSKWVRRVLGAFTLATGANLVALFNYCWTWQYLLFFPALFIGFSMGYGGEDVLTKIIRRSIYAIGILLSCIIGLWATGFTFGGYVLTVLAVITGLTSVALGVLNPFKSARAEEFLVCQVLTMYIPFWPYVGGQ